MKSFYFFLILTSLVDCNESKRVFDDKTLDFGVFTIQAPANWIPIREKGIDSYIGSIAIGNGDTLEFDYGWYSNTLYEYDPVILDSSFMSSMDTSRVNMSEYIWVANRFAVDPDCYRRNNVSWDTNDGRRAKIVYPREPGIGTTGVYIDSVSVDKWVNRFNLYGIDISPENENQVLAAIRTIKFAKKK